MQKARKGMIISMNKKYSYKKAILLAFVLSVVGDFLASFTIVYGSALSDNILFKIALQIFCIIVFASLIYSIIWTEGERDINRIAIGSTTKDPWRGVKIGCIIMIPYMLTSVFLVLAKLDMIKHGDVIYRLLNAHLLILVNAVLPYLGTNLVSMTGINIASQLTGISNIPLQWWQIVVVTLYHLIIPVICGTAYICGFKRINITHFFIYNQKSKKKKN